MGFYTVQRGIQEEIGVKIKRTRGFRSFEGLDEKIYRGSTEESKGESRDGSGVRGVVLNRNWKCNDLDFFKKKEKNKLDIARKVCQIGRKEDL